MPFVVRNTYNSVVDEISDARHLAERVPRYEERFDALEEARKDEEDNAVINSWGRAMGGLNFKRVASIPEPLLGRILELEPKFLTEKEQFFRWLAKHPEYSTYRRRQ